jgi:hypothetical protein
LPNLLNFIPSEQEFYIEPDLASRSRDSLVGIATSYGLNDRGVGVRVPVESRIFLLKIVQTGSEVHPTSYPMGTGGKAAGV